MDSDWLLSIYAILYFIFAGIIVAVVFIVALYLLFSGTTHGDGNDSTSGNTSPNDRRWLLYILLSAR